MGTPAPLPGGTPDPHLRIGDADRHKVAEFLREAAGEGRLEIDELEERIEATYQAKTYADLVPITADLPVPDVQASVPSKPAEGRPEPWSPRPTKTAFYPCLLSGIDRKGVWTVPATINVVAFWGGANLDMRVAQFSARETVVHANAIMGGVNIVVGPEVHVILEGIGILGGYNGPPDEGGSAGGPVLRIRGIALMGGVNVERKLAEPPRSSRRALR